MSYLQPESMECSIIFPPVQTIATMCLTELTHSPATELIKSMPCLYNEHIHVVTFSESPLTHNVDWNTIGHQYHSEDGPVYHNLTSVDRFGVKPSIDISNEHSAIHLLPIARKSLA